MLYLCHAWRFTLPPRFFAPHHPLLPAMGDELADDARQSAAAARDLAALVVALAALARRAVHPRDAARALGGHANWADAAPAIAGVSLTVIQVVKFAIVAGAVAKYAAMRSRSSGSQLRFDHPNVGDR